MTWVSLICLLVLSSAAFSSASYGAFSGRLLHKPRLAMIAPMTTQTFLPTQGYQAAAVQPMMQTNYGASYGSVSPFRQFDLPVVQPLPLSEADIFCKGKRPESIFPIGDGEKYIVCIDEGKGNELSCPKDLIWSLETSRCERRVKDTRNPCDLQPCLNGGQCFPSQYSYQCKCASGFEGLTCELDARVCQTQQPCGSFGAVCQSFHVNAALRHVCILQDGLSYGLNAQQVHQNPCLVRDGLHALAFSDAGYITCNGENMYIHSCPGGTIWSEYNKVCVWPDMQGLPKPSDFPAQQGYGQTNYGSQMELTRQVEKTLIQPRVSSYGGQMELQRPIEKIFDQQPVSSYGSQMELQRPIEKPFVQQPVSSYGSQMELQRPIEKTFDQQPVSSYGSQMELQRPIEKTFGQQQVSSYGRQVQVPLPKLNPMPRNSGY